MAKKKSLPPECKSDPLDKPLVEAYSLFKGNSTAVGYRLVVSIPFQATDDIEARQKAREHFEASGLSDIPADIKLQKLYTDRAPQGLALPFEGPATTVEKTPEVSD